MDARPLAALRIAIGVMMMIEAALLFPAWTDLYGPHGFLDAGLMRVVSGANVPAYAAFLDSRGVSYASLLQAMYWLRWAGALAFTLGAWTPLATFVAWLTESFLMASGPLSNYGLDRYFHLFLFILLFAPAGGAWSVDAWRRGREDAPSARARAAFRFLQLALLLTYVNAGAAKAMGPDWWTGDAVWRVLNLPEFRRADFFWLGAVPLVPKLLSLGTILVETFYLVGVWLPYVGLAWAFAIIGMHLGIAAFMGLVNFGIGMALFNGALIVYPKLRENASARRALVEVGSRIFPRVTARAATAVFRRTQRYPLPAAEAALRKRGERVPLASGNFALRFGNEGPRVLLLHGWSGRGTQLYSFVDPLSAAGFVPVTLDGAGHGDSPGEGSDLGLLVESLRELDQVAGPFHGVVAHSFGGVASLVAASRGFRADAFVLIAVPCTITGTIDHFAEEFGLHGRSRAQFLALVEARAGVRASDVHLGRLGRAANKRALLVHDEGDRVVPLAEAETIADAWPGASLFVTHGLGHYRILKSAEVAAKAADFLRESHGADHGP